MKNLQRYRNYFNRKIIKPIQIKKEDYILPTNSNRFIGGITGRTGTTWLMRLLEDLLEEQNYVSIGESGFFVLSQFRNAAYEYYQPTPGSNLNKGAYLDFLWLFLNNTFDRRRIYGEGLRGLKFLVSKKVLRIIWAHLVKELQESSTLIEYQIAFGHFYSNLLNYYSLLHGDSTNWISKEPGYGRHADDLYRLIPDSKNLILLRDGREVALSMSKRGWFGGDIAIAMNRWNEFAQMTLNALEKVPKENYLLIKYEDLTTNFEEEVRKIFNFFEIHLSEKASSKIEDDSYHLKPKADNISKWKIELSDKYKNLFEQNYKNTLVKLGYK